MIIQIRQLLESLGHKQPPTPLKKDNSTENALVNRSLRQKKYKSWDMKFHWLRNKEQSKYLCAFWERGKKNGADYFTKHHPAPYHKLMRTKHILTNHNIFQHIVNRLYNVARTRVCWNVPSVY